MSLNMFRCLRILEGEIERMPYITFFQCHIPLFFIDAYFAHGSWLMMMDESLQERSPYWSYADFFLIQIKLFKCVIKDMSNYTAELEKKLHKK